jgi:uncharacterized protein
MSEIQYQGPSPIDSYFEGGFRIAGAMHDGSALLVGAEVLAWPVSGVAQLDIPAFAPLVERAEAFDVLLVGMGAEIAPLPAHIREMLAEHALGADIMATPAACRTYNVLLSEGRRVAAALIAMPLTT